MARVSTALRPSVRDRANRRCEYCRLPDEFAEYPFHIEHILSRKHGGLSDLDNLAWACIFCNGFKGSDIGARDPQTGILTELFNPRSQVWVDHFEMINAEITGKTPTGRATVFLLRMNNSPRLLIRMALIQIGKW